MYICVDISDFSCKIFYFLNCKIRESISWNEIEIMTDTKNNLPQVLPLRILMQQWPLACLLTWNHVVYRGITFYFSFVEGNMWSLHEYFVNIMPKKWNDDCGTAAVLKDLYWKCQIFKNWGKLIVTVGDFCCCFPLKVRAVEHFKHVDWEVG